MEQVFSQVKTFGQGADVSAFAWALFIQQFLQQGLLEIDYRDNYHLKITPLGHRVLRSEHAVRLVSPETVMERQERSRKAQVRTARETSPVHTDLLARL